MSDAGEVMDALVTAIGTVSGFTAARGFKLSSDLNDEQFPYGFVFDPDETTEELPFLMDRTTYEIPVWLYFRGETQEAALLKMDSVRDAIQLDRTLGSVVQFNRVTDRRLREDFGDLGMAGSMVVEAVEVTGRIISAEIEVQVEMDPSFGSEFLDFDTAVASFVSSNVTGFSRMTSDYITDRDSMNAEADSKFQQQIAPFIIDYSRTDSPRFALHVKLIFYYHLPAATDELTWIQGTLLPKLDGLLNVQTWLLLTRVSKVREGPALNIGELERQEE